jgi:1,4-dihydroxy-2-naphthoate octaprenyltransferase
MMSLFLAARPKTLLACVSPVCLGGVLAYTRLNEFNLFLFVFTLLPALAIQVATNFFNDAIDFRKGADTARRIGPPRMAVSGKVPPDSLLIAGITMAMIALTLSLVLVAARGWIIVAIGLPSLVFSFAYTGGPWPLAYRGLGEIFVFVFFGLIAVSGTVFIQSGKWLPESFLLGTQVGLLATVLIAINNARDIEEDRAVGKCTLAVRFGIGFARIEVALLSVFPYLAGVLWWFLFDEPEATWMPLPGLLLSCLVACLLFRSDPGQKYNRYLGLSVIGLLNFSILIGIALNS